MSSEDKKPAEENPWYVLMTIAGEQEGESINDKLHKKNRDYWNGLFHRLSYIYALRTHSGENNWAEMSKRISEYSARSLSDTEYEEIIEAIKNRCPNSEPLELVQQLRLSQATDFSDTEFSRKEIDFRDIEFTKTVYCDGFIIPVQVNFRSAIFLREASFNNALFIQISDFYHTIFSSYVSFHNTVFLETADFNDTQFPYGDLNETYFTKAKFYGTASFKGASFHSSAYFKNTEFLYGANFEFTNFCANVDYTGAEFFEFVSFKGACFTSNSFDDDINFSNAKFNAKTNFELTNFIKASPLFYNSILHENTNWRNVTWPNVPQNPDIAHSSRRAYERLKLIMAQQNKFSEEHFFLRKELRCREVENLKTWETYISRFYGYFSDYGWSVKKPALWLLGFWLLGVALIGGIEYFFGKIDIDPWLSIKIGLANTFSFLGISRFIGEGIKPLTILSEIISFIQIFSGLIFFFLLGLGLRNRFRIK